MCLYEHDYMRPAIRPGQLWVVEHRRGEPLCPFDADAIGAANVVLYERALAPLVAEILPLGTYAEALSDDAPFVSLVAPRGLRLAGQGWSVVQLIEARPGRSERWPATAAAMIKSGGLDLTVTAVAKGAGLMARHTEGSLREMPDMLDRVREEAVTLIFGPFAPAYPRPGHIFTAQGLAG